MLGAGLYAHGHVSFEALRAHAAGTAGTAGAAGTGSPDPSLTAVAPRPALVPARELRRLPDPARLGVEVVVQACAMAGIDPGDVVPVFTSTLGDSAITDYMCRTLAGPQKLLSPLRFQNSVHNAPAGSLSILTGNEHPCSFVAAFDDSFALALLEALVLCATQACPVLLVCTDVPVPAPLSDVHGGGALAGCALLLGTADADADAGRSGTVTLSGSVRPHVAAPEATPGGAPLQRPATVQARPVLDALAAGRALDTALPVGPGSALQVRLSARRATGSVPA